MDTTPRANSQTSLRPNACRPRPSHSKSMAIIGAVVAFKGKRKMIFALRKEHRGVGRAPRERIRLARFVRKHVEHIPVSIHTGALPDSYEGDYSAPFKKTKNQTPHSAYRRTKGAQLTSSPRWIPAFAEVLEGMTIRGRGPYTPRSAREAFSSKA